jgi:hypothetical protein
MVECLSSFIHRLAEAHGLPTWVLVRRELAPHFQRKSILGSRGGCELLGKMGGAINGNNASALEAVQILESLTGHANLSGLTLGKLRTLVARRNILRNCQAWCPSCLDEWHQNEKSIYQPLSWLLSDLTFCPQHLCLLEDSCFECKRSHSPLGRYRWDGKCPKCSTWLGRKQSAVSAEATKPISQWDEFATASIPHFILGIQELPKAALPVFPD